MTEPPCLVCGKPLDPAIPPGVHDRSHNQPDEAVVFRAHGQYGSTVFDPMDGTYLEINICDNCVTRLAVNIRHCRPHHPEPARNENPLHTVDARPWRVPPWNERSQR